MTLDFSSEASKPVVFDAVRDELKKNGFTVINEEFRPWGGFFVLDESQAEKFISVYFKESENQNLSAANKLSPKILVVENGKRLSWQYHHRRAELWKVIGGTAGVVQSDTDEENEMGHFKTGHLVKLKQGERHRLVGSGSWGILAEIWQHTDKENPSNEDDIVRISDDFGR